MSLLIDAGKRLVNFSFQRANLYIGINYLVWQKLRSPRHGLPMELARINLLRRSNFVTYLAFPTLSMQSSIRGIGNVSALVTLIYLFSHTNSIDGTHSVTPIWFRNKYTGRTPTTVTWLDEVLLVQILNLFLEVFFLTWI